MLPADGSHLGAPALAADRSAEVWPEISPEERSLKRVDQDPEADAVVLLNERNGKILKEADEILNVLDYHLRYKILTERGKRYGEFEIPAGKYSRVSNIRARTVKPDGTAIVVPSDQIFEKVVFQVADYKETAWVFHFPAVEPGVILEVRYDRHDYSLLFIDPYYFPLSEFTLRSRMTQAIPEDMGYTVLCDLCPNNQQPTVSPWREGKAKGQMYTMELRDIPGYKSEDLMPPERDASPRLEMLLAHWKNRAIWGLGRQNRFFIDWPSVALYAWSYYQDAMKTGLSDIRPVVEGWVQGISDPQEKTKAVFRHVQRDFRYRPFERVFGASHSIAWILKNKIADNEDKAVLLMTALKAIGIDSRLHDIRFVEDDWESPTLGAWGLGWECWCDGMEVSQFTYFQQVAGVECAPVSGELTYGLERLAMYVQGVDRVYDLNFNGSEGAERVSYGDVFLQAEQEYSRHNFQFADTDMLFKQFAMAEEACNRYLDAGWKDGGREAHLMALPAYDQCIKASHAFNLLDARGVISVTERQSYIMRVRELAKACGEAWMKTEAGGAAADGP